MKRMGLVMGVIGLCLIIFSTTFEPSLSSGYTSSTQKGIFVQYQMPNFSCPGAVPSVGSPLPAFSCPGAVPAI